MIYDIKLRRLVVENIESGMKQVDACRIFKVSQSSITSWVKEYLRQIAGVDLADIVYLDESGTDQFIHREYARSRRGKQIISDIKGKKYQRVSMIAGKCGKDILAPMIFTGTADTTLLTVPNHWLEKCLMPDLRSGGKKIIVMDNYSIHKSEKTRNIIENEGHKIIFLPPYSPDLNPIENYWAVIKSRIKKLTKKYTNFNDTIDHAFKIS